MIQTSHLRRTFETTVAVDGLNFDIPAGEIFGLVGPDGAGKTTTMRMLTGVLPPTSGTARVAGFDVMAQTESLKEHIGYMSQRFGLYSDLTVVENIEFYADIYGVPTRGRAAKVDELLGFSNLTPFKKRQAGNLSGGMKQKLGLACALIHTPRVLLLDEPTNGVDPVSRRDFWRILYQLVRDGVTLFISTAYLDEAERCNRLALLHQGNILGLGTPDEVKKLMRGTLYEIVTPAPRQSAASLRETFPEGTVGLFGDRVHLAVQMADKVESRVKARLAKDGLQLESFRSIPPSLEDVFVSVVGDSSSRTNP